MTAIPPVESSKRVKTSLEKGLHTELKKILAAMFLADTSRKAPMVIEVMDEAVFDWINGHSIKEKN